MTSILVVDDDLAVLDGVCHVLEWLGYAVLRAHDGAEALVLARTHPPALILSDYRMPRLSGLELAVAIQSASTSPVGGARMQYHLRQTMVFVEAVVFTKPEIFIAHAQTKFDENAGTFNDEVGRGLIKKQLEGFAKFIERLGPCD